MNGTAKFDVFISHNSKQKPWVRQVVKQWRSLNLRVFFDEDCIDPGEDSTAGIERGLEASRHIVLIISAESVESRWIAMETAIGIHGDPDALKRRVIPVLIDEAAWTNVRLALRHLNYINLADPDVRVEQYHRLLRFLKVDGSLALPDPPALDGPRSAASPALQGITAEDAGTRAAVRTGVYDAGLCAPPRPSLKTPPLQVALVCRSIAESFDELGGVPVDALSIGLYVGEKPRGEALNLDRAIGAAMSPGTGDQEPPRSSVLLLSRFAERGIFRGELGHPFFVNDPRAARRGNSSATPNRVIAVAGMGLPGRFGIPELTVLVRELCWSLGQLGKHHLATAPIGTSNQVLSPVNAISAWMRGLKHALTGMDEEDFYHLRRVTFVVDDPRKIRPIDEALRREVERSRQIRNAEEGPRFEITYANPWNLDQLDGLTRAIREATQREIEAAEPSRWDQGDSGVPTRVTLSLDRRTYRFGAVTETASLPEREVPLDSELVRSANDELAAERDPAMQLERGQFLGRLLVGEDLRPALTSDSPLVMLLDVATARIHWEMIATDESFSSPIAQRYGAETSAGPDPKELFLGTSRGFTRQLRTAFGPPPGPPAPLRQVIRVLVVADPARDARLPGAELEGVEVADLFEQFNQVYQDSPTWMEVIRLFGPSEATRGNVLRWLMLRSFDVLHFAGHCVYDPDDPSASGWLFSNGERISANELRQIDSVPRFVFSNACELGITPDRSELRSADLAPSFAESFFARGVSNFICTAWPVAAAAARQFVLSVYMGLLGLEREGDGLGPRRYQRARVPPLVMHRSMRAARLDIIDAPGGVRTWGAYQHYGNPDFRLFEHESLGHPATSAVGPPATPRKHARRPPAPPKA